MIIAIWLLALVLVGMWSALAWGLYVLATVDIGTLGDLGPWMARVPFGDALEAWFPQWQDIVRLLWDLLHVSLAWLGKALPALVWVLWGLGTGGVVLLAALLTLLVALLQRKAPPSPPAAAGL